MAAKPRYAFSRELTPATAARVSTTPSPTIFAAQVSPQPTRIACADLIDHYVYVDESGGAFIKDNGIRHPVPNPQQQIPNYNASKVVRVDNACLNTLEKADAFLATVVDTQFPNEENISGFWKVISVTGNDFLVRNSLKEMQLYKNGQAGFFYSDSGPINFDLTTSEWELRPDSLYFYAEYASGINADNRMYNYQYSYHYYSEDELQFSNDKVAVRLARDLSETGISEKTIQGTWKLSGYEHSPYLLDRCCAERITFYPDNTALIEYEGTTGGSIGDRIKVNVEYRAGPNVIVVMLSLQAQKWEYNVMVKPQSIVKMTVQSRQEIEFTSFNEAEREHNVWLEYCKLPC